jgi:hypothetical protein
VQIRPHASAFAGLEQLSQSTVPKAFDHTAGDVNRGLTSVKSGFTDRTSLTVSRTAIAGSSTRAIPRGR